MPRAKKKKTDPPDPFDVYTVACPKMRRKWRPEVVPELAAWLVMMRERVALAQLHAIQMAKAYKTDAHTAAVSTFQVRLNFLDELLCQVWDRWTEAAWLTARTHICNTMTHAQAAAHALKEAPPSGDTTDGDRH